jgi:SSS family solute:Na+ symporter
VAADALVPANLIGLAASVILMVIGSLAPQLIAPKGHPIARAHTH